MTPLERYLVWAVLTLLQWVLLVYAPAAAGKALFVGAVAIEGMLAMAGAWNLAMVVVGLYVAAILVLRLRFTSRGSARVPEA